MADFYDSMFSDPPEPPTFEEAIFEWFDYNNRRYWLMHPSVIEEFCKEFGATEIEYKNWLEIWNMRRLGK